MTLKTAREHWQDYCAVAPGIRSQFGLSAALQYVVGEKLMAFAQTAETSEAFRAELPAFCDGVRKLFTKDEIAKHFEATNSASLMEKDLFAEASSEEEEQLHEILEEERQDRERHSWVRAMLLRTGS
jgi:hypothetical protein